MTPGIDVVVVDYRTPDDLAGFIGSFEEVRDEVDAVLHVALVDPLDEAQHRGVVDPSCMNVQVFPTNVGYARACNELGSRGEREVIAFFNADTRLRPGVLAGCRQHLLDNPQVGIVGPRQVDDDCRITHGGIFGTNLHPSFGGRWRARDVGQFSEITETISVSGSAYFIKRECWDVLRSCPLFERVAPDAVGAFLPTQHYYEETYLSFHARYHGWQIHYLGPLAMVHRWHQASPLGEIERRILPTSRAYFRRACDEHGIDHE